MFVVKDCQGSRKTHNRATLFSLVDPAHGHDFDVAATCPASVLIRAKWPTRVLRQREVVCKYSRFVHGSIPAASLSEPRRYRWRLLPGLFVQTRVDLLTGTGRREALVRSFRDPETASSLRALLFRCGQLVDAGIKNLESFSRGRSRVHYVALSTRLRGDARIAKEIC